MSATTDPCAPRRLYTTKDMHKAFHNEWGTWCDTENLDEVMRLLGEIRLVAHDELMD